MVLFDLLSPALTVCTAPSSSNSALSLLHVSEPASVPIFPLNGRAGQCAVSNSARALPAVTLVARMVFSSTRNPETATVAPTSGGAYLIDQLDDTLTIAL